MGRELSQIVGLTGYDAVTQPPREPYIVSCHACQATFDALETDWCSCLVAERTLVCPSCLSCFCKAAPAYKQKFWSAAPRSLWDLKFAEHDPSLGPAANPDVAPEAPGLRP